MKRLLIAAFKHETDCFCPEPADMEAFKVRGFYLGEEMLKAYRGVKNEPGAFFDTFRGREDIEIIPVLSMNAMPSGPVTGEAYEFATSRILEAVRNEKPDGVLLSLHGAMVADGHDDGEGDLLAMIREEIGPDIPLVVSLDLHANITSKMAANADALVPYEKYPHTDMYETGLAAAQIMDKMLRGERIEMGYHRVPYLNPMFPSDFPEIRQFHELCKSYEQKNGVISARLAHGFYPADIEEMGMAVVVICEKGCGEDAQKLADEAGNTIWERRGELKRHFPTLEEAFSMIGENGEGPLVIADASDNPGGGGLCDTTHILRALLENGIEGAAFGKIHDPESVRKCEQAGVGAEVDLMLGGRSDPAVSGGPLAVKARVKHLTDGFYRNRDEMSQGVMNNLGHTAVIETGGNLVIVSTNRLQPYDAELFRHCGISPERQKVLIVKSAVHYRHSYGKFARKMVEVALPGYVPPVPDGLPFRKWKGEV